MGLNLQPCQPSRPPMLTKHDPLIAENLHHRVCSNLVKMRRKGKFSCKKMILVIGSPENRAWMVVIDGFLYWKTRRAWQIQSVQHGGRNLVWRSFLTNATKQGETWREQCVFYWDLRLLVAFSFSLHVCKRHIYNGTKSLSAIPSPWNVYCSRHLSVCPAGDKKAGKRVLLQRTKQTLGSLSYNKPNLSNPKVHCVLRRFTTLAPWPA